MRRPGPLLARLLTTLVATTTLGAVALTGCEPAPAQIEITYEVQFKGAPLGNHQQFADHVAKTLADGRGWAMSGRIRYRRVASGGKMVVWLVEARHMADFGPPCNATWSCRSGRNVAVNDDRWRTATPSWRLGLDDYQHYVVIHEVGHFMGQPHAACGGAGQAAPVMMQQSKGVAPCTNRTWPLTWEKQQVAARWGVQL